MPFAVRIHEFGAPSTLKIDEVPKPSAGPGHVVVHVLLRPVVCSNARYFQRQTAQEHPRFGYRILPTICLSVATTLDSRQKSSLLYLVWVSPIMHMRQK